MAPEAAKPFFGTTDELLASLQRELAEARAALEGARAEITEFFNHPVCGSNIHDAYCYPRAAIDKLLKSLTAPGPSDAKGEPLPVQVHRKLEAIAESLGVKDWQAAGTSTLASLIAERVRELEGEVEKLQNELAEWVQSTNRQAGRANSAKSEGERLRKAIETHRHKNTGMACDHKQSDLELWSALTPPTASSGEDNQTGETSCNAQTAREQVKARNQEPTAGPATEPAKCATDAVRRSMSASATTMTPTKIKPPSAPAAESEGGESSGDGQLDAVAGAMKLMENKLLCFDENDQPRFVEVEPIVAANYKRNLHKAMDLLKQNRALSARLAACEERLARLSDAAKAVVRAQERGEPIAPSIAFLADVRLSLLAPKAEGGNNAD